LIPVELGRDHVLGPPDAEITLVEYGSYACPRCHAVHEVIEGLRSRFGERMKYVFRHLPVAGSQDATRAAKLAEYAAQTTGHFWEIHETLMEHGPVLSEDEFVSIARSAHLPPSDDVQEPGLAAAQARVRADIESAKRSGAQVHSATRGAVCLRRPFSRSITGLWE
jgi:NhaA family Na+:H+ antiporter